MSDEKRWVVRLVSDNDLHGWYWCGSTWSPDQRMAKRTSERTARRVARKHGGLAVLLVSRAEAVERARREARAEALEEVRGYFAQCYDLEVYVADVLDEIDRLAKEQR